MRPTLFMIFMFFSSLSYADPFYGDNENQEKQGQNKEVVKKVENNTACVPTESVNSIMLDTEFDKLLFVGVIQMNDEFKALFINEKKQLMDFKVNDFIEQDSIQIKSIDLKSVGYIKWNQIKQCDKPIVTQLKL